VAKGLRGGPRIRSGRGGEKINLKLYVDSKYEREEKAYENNFTVCGCEVWSLNIKKMIFLFTFVKKAI
jgi:hypothetical protein